MAIPDYQTVMLPILKLVAKQGQIKLRDARAMIADEFKLTDSEKAALLPSGHPVTCQSHPLRVPYRYNAQRWALIHQPVKGRKKHLSWVASAAMTLTPDQYLALQVFANANDANHLSL